jgi:acetyl esterase/lipase
VTPCRAYVERLRAAGKDVQLTAYPGAHHVFDNPVLSATPTVLPRAQTSRRCVLKEAPEGRIINAETGQSFTWADPCVARGVHIAYNPVAYAAALRAVKDFLRSTLKLN